MVLGNSFSTIQLNTLNETMRTRYSFVRDSLGFLEHVNLDYECAHTNAFSDFCFQIFNPPGDGGGVGGHELINNLVEDNYNNNNNKDDDEYESVLKEPIYEESEEIFL